MSRLVAGLRGGVARLADACIGLSPALYLAAAAIILIAGFSGDFYVMEILVLVIIYAQFAASWDVLSGYTEQDNFGHAFFIGGAGYLAAILNKWLHVTPWLAVPVGAAVAALVGMGVGWLTLRLRGPYFALSTIAFSAVLFKLAFIFSRFTGGEEGLSGVDPFTQDVSTDLYTALALFMVSVICLTAFARSHYGLVLRSTQHNEDAAQASGINTAHYKVVGFVVSGFFAGVGGGMYAHTHMQVNPELLAGSLSVLVVLLATIGGRGTIIGPTFAAGLLTLFGEWLRVIEEFRVVIFTGVLILLVYLFPSGLANTGLVSRSRILRRFLLGRGV
jgi:branched-chain amino acid transport system permease protein